MNTQQIVAVISLLVTVASLTVLGYLLKSLREQINTWKEEYSALHRKHNELYGQFEQFKKVSNEVKLHWIECEETLKANGLSRVPVSEDGRLTVELGEGELQVVLDYRVCKLANDAYDDEILHGTGGAGGWSDEPPIRVSSAQEGNS